MGAAAGSDIATDNVDPGKGLVLFHLRDDVQDSPRIAISRVHDQHIYSRFQQRSRAIPGIAEETHRGSHPKATFVIFGGVGILFTLVKILDGDQPFEATLRIH